MSEPKWTPGPWRKATKGNMGNLIEAYRGDPTYEGDNGYRTVASYQECTPSRRYDDQEENRRANGDLIAAAPDLYAALAPLANADPDNPPPGVSVDDWRAAVHAARSARAKARGET